MSGEFKSAGPGQGQPAQLKPAKSLVDRCVKAVKRFACRFGVAAQSDCFHHAGRKDLPTATGLPWWSGGTTATAHDEEAIDSDEQSAAAHLAHAATSLLSSWQLKNVNVCLRSNNMRFNQGTGIC
jgi:hypothetical protein